MILHFARRFQRHIGADQAVRYLDGELDIRERQRVEEHLATCRPCGATVEGTRLQASEVRRLISAADVTTPVIARATSESHVVEPVRPRRRHGILILAAVACGLFIAAIAGVAPVRAWVADRWDNVRAIFGASDGSTVEAAALNVDGKRPSVLFTPTADTFVLGIAHHQARGRLLIRFHDDERARAEVVNGTDEDLAVLPEGLRILNGPESSASYHVTIPARYASIVLELGNVPGITLYRDPADPTLHVDLGNAR